MQIPSKIPSNISVVHGKITVLASHQLMFTIALSASNLFFSMPKMYSLKFINTPT